ncbi:MAG: ATPase domain-containing protein [Bacillota bacterium]
MGIEVYPRMRPEGKELRYEVKQGRKGFGIPDLDEMLSDGLLEGTITLISGGTGVGKTILALKFLLEGAEKGEKGIFLSFEEPAAQLQNTARHLGWEIDRYLAQGLLDIEFISPVELDVDKHAFEILDMIREKKVERFVIDSISSFENSVSDLQKYNDYLWALGQQLRRRQINTIFTAVNDDPFSSLIVSKTQISLTIDNIIILRYVEDNSHIKKVLGIMKTRGSYHNKDLREFEITPNGISILGKLDRADMLK